MINIWIIGIWLILAIVNVILIEFYDPEDITLWEMIFNIITSPLMFLIIIVIIMHENLKDKVTDIVIIKKE